MPKRHGQCGGIRFSRSVRAVLESYAHIALRRAQKIVQPARMDFALLEIACCEDAPEKLDVRLDATRIIFAEGPLEPSNRLGAVPAPPHQLAEQGVVFIGPRPAAINTVIKADPRPGGYAQLVYFPGRRGKVILGIFGIDAAFDRMPPNGDVFLPERQSVALCDADLQFHEVE